MIIPLFLRIFFFHPLDLGMTGVTMIASGSDIHSPLITVYGLVVLRIDTIEGEIFVHDVNHIRNYRIFTLPLENVRKSLRLANNPRSGTSYHSHVMAF